MSGGERGGGDDGSIDWMRLVGSAHRDVGLDRLLAAPVARGAELRVVHPAADAVSHARVVAVGHRDELSLALAEDLCGFARRPARGCEVVVAGVLEAVALGVVDLDALAGAPAAALLRDERLDPRLALRDGTG